MTWRRAVGAAAFACWGCGGGARSSPAAPAPYDPESITFAEELGVDLAAMEVTPLGLYLKDVTVGEGLTAQRNSLVTLNTTLVFDVQLLDVR